MRVQLNNVQRGGLVAAAIVIAFILYRQIDDNGLEDTPWLLGILVILALLMFSTARSLPGQNASEKAVHPPILNDGTGLKLKADFLEITQRLEDFFRTKVSDIPHTLPVHFFAETAGYLSGVAFRGAFMLTLLKREKQKRGYSESVEVGQLRILAGGLLANSKLEDLRKTSEGEPPKRSDMLKEAAKELARCEVTVRQVLHDIAVAKPYSMDPIFKLIDQEFPLSDGEQAERDETYGPIARAILEERSPS